MPSAPTRDLKYNYVHALPESRQTEVGVVRQFLAVAKAATTGVADVRGRGDGRASQARHWEAVAARSC
jgi:hypothetical protein